MPDNIGKLGLKLLFLIKIGIMFVLVALFYENLYNNSKIYSQKLYTIRDKRKRKN